jgi:ATP-binding cassette subfamily F protein 3
MIQLAQLSKAFGGRVLLDTVTWQLGLRDRVGLCGPNGAGKTTLLRMLAGLDEPDAGSIVKPQGLTVGYLPQDGLDHSGRSLVEEARSAFAELLGQKQELHDLEHRLGDPSVPEGEHERMLVRYAELQERFRRADGYAIDQRVATVLRGLGFSDADMDLPTETFSGGWQMRIALAKLLLGRPGLLLLDEPTNHLDLDARNWLEEYLTEYPAAVILVSHDRYFLDAVTTRIVEINLRTLTEYSGNYTDYLRESQARLERLRQAKKEQDEEVARIRLFIDRFRYQATKAAQVQSRVKLLEKVVPIEVPPARERVRFRFPAAPKSGRAVLDLKQVRKAYGDKVVFNGTSLLVERGDRLALIGPNGVGKSTLMRMLSGVEAPDHGAREVGYQVVMQYFAQDEAARLDPTLTVYETLAEGSPLHMVPAIRTILGGFLFHGDDVYKKVAVLSGGERTRLAVARMLLRPSNALLLDEPTNHLDMDSKDVLLDALEDFGGTLILVSHDRYFIDRLATRIVDVGGGGLIVYPGTYEEYRWSRAQREAGASDGPRGSAEPSNAAARRSPPRPAPPRAPGTPSSSAALDPAADGPVRPPVDPSDTGVPPQRGTSREQKKQIEAEQRRHRRAIEALRARVTDLEGRIGERESAIKELEATMSAPGFYANHETSRPVIDRHQTLMWDVGDLMGQWEMLQEEIAALEAQAPRAPGA